MSGYTLHIPTSGGKAGKGMNATGSIQVRKDSMIKKQFRFKTGDMNSKGRALLKANRWIASQPLNLSPLPMTNHEHSN